MSCSCGIISLSISVDYISSKFITYFKEVKGQATGVCRGEVEMLLVMSLPKSFQAPS